MKECTFSPSIIELKTSPVKRVTEKKGVKNYLERQQYARKLKNTSNDQNRIINSPNSPHRDITRHEYSQARKKLHDDLHSLLI